MTNPVVSIDGLELKEFDYIDIGTMLESSGAVPVVIKSLIFPGSATAGEATRACRYSVTSSTTPSAAIAPPAVRAAKRTGMRLAARPMRNADQVQHERRGDEARAIGQRRGIRRQFDAVAVAVQQPRTARSAAR